MKMSIHLTQGEAATEEPLAWAPFKRPVFVSGADPVCTQQANTDRAAGLIVVDCDITEQGIVRNCKVRNSDPQMESTVVEALQHRKYIPATDGGEPVAVSREFSLHLECGRR